MALNSRLAKKTSLVDANLPKPGHTRSNATVPTSTVAPVANRSGAMAAQRRTASALNSATSVRNVPPPSATLARSNRKQLDKTGTVSKTSTNNRGLKLRSANAPVPAPLPILCIYSDQNELIRKEQFRVPVTTILNSRVPPMIDPQQFTQSKSAPLRSRNNENLNNAPLRTAAGATKRPALSNKAVEPSNQNQRLKSTAGTRASQPAPRMEIPTASQRLKFNRNSSMSAPSTTSNRSTAVKTAAKPTTTLAPGEKVIRRRNENVSQGRKAEMTSAGAAVIAAAATATATGAATTGWNAALSARKGGEVVRISVAVQTANRTDGKPHSTRAPAKKPSCSKSSKLPLRVVIEPKSARSARQPTGKTQISKTDLHVPAAGLLAPAHMTIDILRRPNDQQDVHSVHSMPESGLLVPVAITSANPPMAFPHCIDSPDGHKPDKRLILPADASCEDIVCDKDNYVLFDYPDRFINEHAIYSSVREADDDEDEGEVEEEDSRSSSSSSCKNHHSDMMVQETMVSNHDPGYGSEKSPDDDEEEETITKCIVTSPTTPLSPCSPLAPNTLTNVSHQDSSAREDDILDDFFKFVSNENIFKVVVHKTAQGLGLSVTGGAPVPAAVLSGAVAITLLDSSDDVGKSPAATCQAGGSASWSGLIRIKKIFPHGAAWQTGQLAVGDVLLAANGVALTGSTNYEALEVLRCSPRETELLVCRIPSDIADKMGLHPPESPASSGASSNPTSSHSNHWLSPVLPLSALGEFEISMTKVNGSLGFTLRKEDESILGHYIRSLVKEPAISDGRIKPGDKIISVNNVDMSTMSHAEAVAFLRRCPETVTIRLFRDSAVTPLSPLSPTEPESSSLNRPRPLLRQEAQDLLHDLAVRKQSNSRGGSPAPISGSPCSPRRRRLTKTPSPDLAAVVRDRYGSNSSIKDSITVPLSSSGSPPMSPLPEMDTERDGLPSGLDLTDSSSFHTPTGGTHQRATRPDFLDLSNSLVKKQRFMFTPPTDHPPSTFEVRQSGDGRPVDPNESEVSEYMTPTRMADDSSSLAHDWSRGSPPGSVGGGDHHDNVSLNNECVDRSTVNEDTTMNDDEFVSPSIMERYAPQGLSDHDMASKFPLPTLAINSTGTGKEGLVKWKGIVLTPDEEYVEEAHLGLIQTVELNKGWNSRLGFSVGVGSDGQLVISAIYDDSVAAKDGRLEVGDRVLRVNGEKLDGCSKEYVIDILRKTRGPVAITVRKTA